MKLITTYEFFLKSLVYVMLISQIWVNTISYCQWSMDGEIELIELTNSEEKESDTESEGEDNKKEKDDKIHTNDYHSTYDPLVAIICVLHSKAFLVNHNLEITTPPPEGILLS